MDEIAVKLNEMSRGVKMGPKGLDTTALGFGVAGLFRNPSRKSRYQMIELALEVGVRHFDMAPMYGLGHAQKEFSDIIRGRRGQVFIATKFGIAPTNLARALGRVQAPARLLLRSLPSLQQQARSSAAGPTSGRLGPLLYRNAYDPSAAKNSLETCLRELNTDYIDLLLIHDPRPSDLDYDEVCSFLEDAKHSGTIRQWGVAGEACPTLEVVDRLPRPSPVIQIREDIFQRIEPGPGEKPEFRITFGALGNALFQIHSHVMVNEETLAIWSATVGADCSDLEAIASLLMRYAFRINPSGTVLYTTCRPSRLRSVADLSSQVPIRPDPSLDAFSQLVVDELGTGRPTGRDEA